MGEGRRSGNGMDRTGLDRIGLAVLARTGPGGKGKAVVERNGQEGIGEAVRDRTGLDGIGMERRSRTGLEWTGVEGKGGRGKDGTGTEWKGGQGQDGMGLEGKGEAVVEWTGRDWTGRAVRDRTGWDGIGKEWKGGRGVTKPTSYNDLYAWHVNALKGVDGDEVKIHDGEPQCGWFKCRLVKKGPFVPARIWVVAETDDNGDLIDEELYQCEVDGEYRDPEQQWLHLSKYPIPKAEFDYLTSLAAWARACEPSHPLANPRKAVDYTTAPMPQFKRRK